MLIVLIFLSQFSWSQGIVSPIPKKPPVPKDNPQTKEKIELGKMLFFDPRLSYNGTVSCNSCHNVMTDGADGRAVSVGVNGHKGGRGAPTVLNSAFLSVQFWDGRAKSLEEQAKGPLINPIEMGNKDHGQVVSRLKKIPGYVKKFAKVFKGKEVLTIDNVAKAIASYERTLITPNSPFDRYLKGYKKGLSSKAKKGWETFQKVGCVTCHNGTNFAGPALPEGTGYFMKFPTYPNTKYDKKYKFTKDLGRYDQTKQEADKNMWRVPTLRNIALTAPYFHNGAVETLDEAVRVMAKTQLDKTLNVRQVSQIVDFLESLTGKMPKQNMPLLPPTLGKVVIDAK